MAKKRKQLTNVHRYRRQAGGAKTSVEPKEKSKKIPTAVLQARGRQTQNRQKISMRQEFERAKRAYKERLVYEQAMREALGGGSIESRITTPFHVLDYETVRKKGVKRKIGGKMETFTGKEAVKLQTLSLRARASGRMQADLFVNNYYSAGVRAGYSHETMERAASMLREVSPDKLSVLIRRGILPSVAYVYSGTKSGSDLLDEIEGAINSVSESDVIKIKEKAKGLEPYVRTKMRG